MYKITIEDLDNNKTLFDSTSDHVIGANGKTLFYVGESSENKMLNDVSIILENSICSILYNIFVPSEEFVDVSKYKDKFDDSTKCKFISSLSNYLDMVSTAVRRKVSEKLEYENENNEEYKYTINVTDNEYNDTIRKFNTNSLFLCVPSFGSMCILDNEIDKEKNREIVFQTACNVTSYLAKLLLSLELDLDLGEVDSRVQNGDEKMFEVFNDVLDSIHDSLKDYHKDEHLKSIMNKNNLKSIVDTEEFMKQMLDHFTKNLFNQNNDSDDEDDASE